MIICGYCQSKFTSVYTSKGKGNKHYRYYICNRKIRGGNDGCESERFPAGQLEEIIIKKVLKILKSPEIIMHAITGAKRCFI